MADKDPSKPSEPLAWAPADGETTRSFRRGKTFPRAITWFGLRSFWGHLWHLAASVIATEDIDSRDWMMPQTCSDFSKRVADQLGARRDGVSLTEALDDDLWIDFVADTGDDADVSQAVAELIFAEHTVMEGDDVCVLPRGGLLVFGGDTAYPVATDLEIHNRVTVPFNRVLRKRPDPKRRVLLGIPGNHDWYAGLDGFGRMFRERRGRVDRASRVASDEPDTAGQIGHLIEWIEAFRVGTQVNKRPALPLDGYTTVQTASYWSLQLAPQLQLWGVDRQLRNMDFRQQNYFAETRDRQVEAGLIVVMPDPAYAYLKEYSIGQRIMQALNQRVDDGHLVLSGDTHHYNRMQVGEGIHVTAGGGGAFLHPTRIHRAGVVHPACEFPGPKTSLSLIAGAPLRLASGLAGVMVQIGLLLAYLPFLAASEASFRMVALGVGAVLSLACVLLAGWRDGRLATITALSTVTGMSLGALPVAIHIVFRATLEWLGLALPTLAFSLLWMLGSLAAGGLLFGLFLLALYILGLEHNQAAGMLAHPGFKHFVRLRVQKDGSRVDAWVIGKVDTLNPDEKPCLIDRFVWQNPASVEPDM